MKHLILASVLFFLSLPLFGQKYTLDPHRPIVRNQYATIFSASENLLSKRKWMYVKFDHIGEFLDKMLHENDKNGSSEYAPRQYGASLPLKKNKLYLLGEADDSTYIFAHSQGIYLGDFKQEKNKPTFLREGIGIDKVKVYSKENAYKYYIGNYLKNKKHGAGFFVNGKGEMYAGVWKKGRLLRKTKRELTDVEKDKISSYVSTINNM